MTDPTDPLGRLAAHAAKPYDAPAVSEKTLAAYWRDLYAAEAREMDAADLAVELALARERVATCEEALKAAEAKPCHSGWLPGSWDIEQEYRANAIERDNFRHRIVRLRGRRDALAAETVRRGLATQNAQTPVSVLHDAREDGS